jgi:hypothetical protein
MPRTEGERRGYWGRVERQEAQQVPSGGQATSCPWEYCGRGSFWITYNLVHGAKASNIRLLQAEVGLRGRRTYQPRQAKLPHERA